ncbi:MAG: NADH-quinone oxidoreductase subunit J [Gaiellales bacterium]
MILASQAGEIMVWVIWVVAGLGLLASGFAVVLFSNPFYSALALILNLGSLAVLYLLLSAEFVAAAQVLVYAGAVMVMFLFVIAYLGGRADTPFSGGRSLARTAALVACLAIFVEVVVVVASEAGGTLANAAEISGSFGSPREIGALFLSDYLIAFEVTSIVLLVGAVGGVILGSGVRRDLRTRGELSERDEQEAA